ncbi:phosphatase PAP2 family protein [Streptomyces katrae]|uniref:phosphatase PAP2 family protein n=1 Tax=Streptomyces katrae TaxID=68223 RepID=UPI00055CA4D1|nr:phosphatase PAP2 family protein [Streptomyces katrae]
MERADRWATRSVAAWDGALARRVFPAVGRAAEHTKLWLATACVLAATGGAAGRRAAMSGLAGMAGGQLLAALAKRTWERRRPPAELIPHSRVQERPDTSSFPSGHTAAAVAFTTSVVPEWPTAGAVCAALSAAVGLDRIHSGAHYPSDVAAGAVIGLVGSRSVRMAVRTRFGRHPGAG